jgi:hypothetical protein
MFDQTINVNSILLTLLPSNVSRFYYALRLLDKKGSGKAIISNITSFLNTLKISRKTFNRLLDNKLVVFGKRLVGENKVIVFYHSEITLLKQLGVKSVNDVAYVDVLFKDVLSKPKSLGRLLTVKYIHKKTYFGLNKQLNDTSSDKVVLTNKLMEKKEQLDEIRQQRKPITKQSFFVQAQGTKLLSFSNNDVVITHKDKTITWQHSLLNLSKRLTKQFNTSFSYSSLQKDLLNVDKFICYQLSDNNKHEYMLNTLSKEKCNPVIVYSKSLKQYVRKLPNIICFNDYYFHNKQFKKQKYNNVLSSPSGGNA